MVPVRVSISSMVYPPLSVNALIASIIAYIPMRFPMKLGVSLAMTTPLPRYKLANHSILASTSAEVSGVGISSSNLR